MRHTSLAPLAVLSLLAAVACDPGGSDEESGAAPNDTDGGDDAPATSNGSGEDDTTGGDDVVDDSGEGGSEDAGSTGEPETTGGGEFSWREGAGPCGGSITNAMWFDDRMNGFIGCGENASGEGLFTTIDGGATWDDNVRFKEVRIMDIRRGPDGVLYGAGIHQLDDYAVWSFDESGANIDSEGLYTSSNNAFLAVNQAENAAITEDGQMLIDSLTGTTAAYRAAGGEFVEVDSLSEDLLDDPDASGYQVRRIKALDNRFYAVGSVINDPARVHLPSQLDGATHHFHTVLLQPDTRDGELLDMHIWDAQRMIVAGFDQSERFPLIYRVDGGDPYSGDSWEQIELLDFGIEYEGGIEGISVSGDTVVAVGEKVPTSSGGFIVISQDAGVTWEDVAPEELGKLPTLSRVKLFESGEMVLAGGGGSMLFYDAQ